jgi:hypothetical protein
MPPHRYDRFVRIAALALLAVQAGSCASPAAPRPADVPTEQPHDATRFYTISLGGSRIGSAVESERWTRTGLHLERVERLRFLRGDADVALVTTIDIDANAALVANHVRWTEKSDHDERAAEATRASSGWQLSSGGSLPAGAVPAELAPILVRRDGRFDGDLFLPARGFVSGSGRIEPVAPGRLVARMAIDTTPHIAGSSPRDEKTSTADQSPRVLVEATIDLDADGSPARIVDGEGVIALRTTEAQVAEWFDPVDLIAATSIDIQGVHRRDRIALDGALALPAVPGQQAVPSAGGLDVELDAGLAGDLPPGPASADRSAEIRALVATVRARITPDLGASHTTSRDASSATAGDCTTFALAYTALASQRGIPTRVVTGLRVDHARLIRHRWAVSWTGTRWIAIDAAFGAVPAGGNLIGLAVHDADDAGLVAGESALTQVRCATWD